MKGPQAKVQEGGDRSVDDECLRVHVAGLLVITPHQFKSLPRRIGMPCQEKKIILC